MTGLNARSSFRFWLSVATLFLVADVVAPNIHAQIRTTHAIIMPDWSLFAGYFLRADNGVLLDASLSGKPIYTTSAEALFRIDQNGHTRWGRVLGYPDIVWAAEKSVLEEYSDGGLDLGVTSYGTDQNGWDRAFWSLIRLDSSGAVVSSTSKKYDILLGCTFASRGTGKIRLGWYPIEKGTDQIVYSNTITKFTSDGSLEWATRPRRLPSDTEFAQVALNRLLEAPNGDIIGVGSIAGRYPHEAAGIVLRLDKDGNLLNSVAFGGTASGRYLGSIISLNDSSFVASRLLNDTCTAICFGYDLQERWATQIACDDLVYDCGAFRASNGEPEFIARREKYNSHGGLDTTQTAFIRLTTDGQVRYVRASSATQPIELRDAIRVGEGWFASAGERLTYFDANDSACGISDLPFTTVHVLTERQIQLQAIPVSPIVSDTVLEFNLTPLAATDSLICDPALPSEVKSSAPVPLDNWLIVPNPTGSGSSEISLIPPETLGVRRIQIVLRNSCGAVVRAARAVIGDGNRQVRIPTTSTAAGAYFIEVYDDAGRALLWSGRVAVQ